MDLLFKLLKIGNYLVTDFANFIKKLISVHRNLLFPKLVLLDLTDVSRSLGTVLNEIGVGQI